MESRRSEMTSVPAPMIAPLTPMCNALEQPRLAAAAFRQYTIHTNKSNPQSRLLLLLLLLLWGCVLLSPLALHFKSSLPAFTFTFSKLMHTHTHARTERKAPSLFFLFYFLFFSLFHFLVELHSR